MNIAKSFFVASAVLIASSSFAAGDPAVGAVKAAACVSCHGNNAFPGFFPLVQLAGRNADKLVIKTNKYHNWKIISPMMNLAVMPLTQQDIEDISAYYQSLGKPAFPMQGIRGDEDTQAGG